MRGISKNTVVWIRSLQQLLREPSLHNCFRWATDYDFRRGLAYFGRLGIVEASTIIDVGAASGRWSDMALAFFKSAKVIAVEPEPDYATNLRKRFEGKSVEIVEMALSDAPANDKPFFVSRNRASSSLLRPLNNVDGRFPTDISPSGTITVKVGTLEALLDKFDIVTVDVLKIDVQGAEVNVLQGAGRLLSQFKNVVLEISFQPSYEGAPPFREVHDWLCGRGFVLCNLFGFSHNKRGELYEADAHYRRL